MSRRLLLLRHGRTAWNVEGRFQGHTDTDLDDVGLAQALAVAPVIAEMHPVAVWSSDLTRARRTSLCVADAAALQPVLDGRLREYDVGERAGLTSAEFEARFPGGSHDGSHGAESHEQVRTRILAALEDCWSTLEPGTLGVVVAHGSVLRNGLVALLGWPRQAADSLHRLDNCGWIELREGLGGRPQLAAYNRVVPPISPRSDGSANVLASS